MSEKIPRRVEGMASVLSCIIALTGAAKADDITLFAASSMATALSEIEKGFEAATGHNLIVSLGGSSSMARQIQRGAPADVFISASPDWMDVIEDQGLIVPGTRKDLLGNTLVLIAHDRDAPEVEIGPDMNLSGLLGNGLLAMALVDAVPAGMYGKAALQTLGQWESVRQRVVQTDNVRAALALVALGEAPYGIVYATDAAADGNVTILATFTDDTHPPILYPVAAIVGSEGPASQDLLIYLRGPEARAAFEDHGFRVITD